MNWIAEDWPTVRENSDVSPRAVVAPIVDSLVAVAERYVPAGYAVVIMASITASPLASVVTSADPNRFCPCPNPEGSGAGLVKNWRRNLVPAALWRLP